MNKPLMNDTPVSIKIKSLIRRKEEEQSAERMSSRMTRCAGVLDSSGVIGWEMVVPKRGSVTMTLFGTGGLQEKDLKWISEHLAETVKSKFSESVGRECSELYELILPAGEASESREIGFQRSGEGCTSVEIFQWPKRYSVQFPEMLRALSEEGGYFRVVLGSVMSSEGLRNKKEWLRHWKDDLEIFDEYMGTPLRTRFLLRLSSAPSIRLRSILKEAIPQAKLRYLGSMKEAECRESWNDPLSDAKILPEYAARIMLLEPTVSDHIEGVELSGEKMKLFPAYHKNTNSAHSIFLGHAISSSGKKRSIRLEKRI